MHDETRDHASTAEFILSEVEAVLAGTLALMTAMAQGCCNEHRRAIRQKVIANLAELEQHALLSEQFRAVASHLQRHWHALAIDLAAQDRAQSSQWHEPPRALQ